MAREYKTNNRELKMGKESSLSNRDRKLIKTVSGRTFLEEGYGTNECPGCPSPVPRWFVDLRYKREIRVNILTDATLYLRNDGHLFSICKQLGDPMPLDNAFTDNEEYNKYVDNVYMSEKASENCLLWETCEYLPDEECPDRKNIWRVAAEARRSGRYIYTTKRKTAKQYIEGSEEDIPWIYAEKFDQYTEEYEQRYQRRVKERAKEIEAEEEYRRKNTRGVHFNAKDFYIPKNPIIDHHAVLGIRKKASLREVKQAYWSLAKKYHPDLNPNNSMAEEKFKSVSVAYNEIMREF